MRHIQAAILRLDELRAEHGFRGATLVPDLAFLGLVHDAIDAVRAAVLVLESEHPHRAYSLARVVFESAQRLLVLAAADDYLNVGARAWLYYRLRDAPNGARRTTTKADDQVIEVWRKSLPSAKAIADSALASLVAQRGPDNFLGRPLAPAVTEALASISRFCRGQVAEELTELNREIYGLLSRETHASMRLTPTELRVDRDGFVEVIDGARDVQQDREIVVDILETALHEIIGAIEHRLWRRRSEHVVDLKEAATIVQKELPKGYAPDLGLEWLKQGLGSAESIFPAVPLQVIRELGDGTLTTTLNLGLGAERRAASFDFKGAARRDLLEVVYRRFPTLRQRPKSGRTELALPTPLVIDLHVSLGELQHSDTEAFVPFVVHKITESEHGYAG